VRPALAMRRQSRILVPMSKTVDVIVSGAGPTGLFLALLLVRLGLRVRIIDEAAEPGTTSRALAVQARTLEFYRQVDLADEVVRRGLVLGAVNLWRRGERAARIDIGEVGRGKSPFPFGIIFPQDEHERLLIERLEALGAHVERRTKLTAVDARPDGAVVARLRMPDGTAAACEASFLAGCDGARSTIREAIGAGFPGGTYDHLFYVADVEARGAPMNQELHVLLDDAGFLGLFPLAGEGRARLIGTIREDATGSGKAIEWNDVDRGPIERIGLQIDRINWFSTYHVHHRVADRFRKNRVFLLGDAAHIHSPVGGQGMNTGLGDAMNLAWKLAAVIGGRANEDLLDTYEPERIAFARRLVATTDRVFKAASSDGRLAGVVRTQIVPRIIPRITGTSLGQRLFFRALSQTGIEYRATAWSTGRAGPVHGGDRLPWVEPARRGSDDNFTPLRSLDWQAHVYGAPLADLRALCEERRLPLHVFPSSAPAKLAGFRDGAVYLVRPDGYVGAVVDAGGAAASLAEYLDVHGIRCR
jgi:2-polyprenyl-6-methoxyphenol hydroxylase-like FAD-dependent oxidoreductase